MNGTANGHSNGSTSIRPVGRAEVMAAVLDAATELFAERGPDAVTVREVADRAGVNHALIHRHYGTKQELLRVVLSKAIERMAAISQDVTSTRDHVMPIVAAMHELEPAVRLLAWAILSGYPIDELWPEYPAITRFRTVLADEQSATGSSGREDPDVAVTTSAALVLGWVIFRPMLERAANLPPLSTDDEQQMLNRAVQQLFDGVR